MITRAGTNVRIVGHSGLIRQFIMAQESVNDWWEYAKGLARAERELQIERWVYISIGYKDEAGNPVRLHSYNLPRELHERYRWVIRWRVAKLQCLHIGNLPIKWFCILQIDFYYKRINSFQIFRIMI